MHHKQRWTAQRIRRRLEQLLTQQYARSQELPPFRFKQLDGPHTPPDLDGPTDSWTEVPPRSYWGRWRIDFMLRCEFELPEWGEALYLPLGESGDFAHPEALVYLDEQPVAACDRQHHEIRLPHGLKPGVHRFALHGWSGLGGNVKTDLRRKLYLDRPLVVQIHKDLREFHALARCALGVAEALHENDPARGRLLNALEAAFQHEEDLEEARRVLRANLKDAPLDVDLWATGHAHIDVAWLWTYGQTRRKAGRTFHTVLHLMDQFPEYHFTQSQPALYHYVQQDYPELFARIQQRAREGRWEPTGGMWVEADGNLSGAEALVRQFVLGRRFYEEHFPGLATPILWLPDVFGYPASLPQLVKQAGLEYFFTIKIGWSQYNRLPFDSFWWQGLDGTRVLTSFSTTPCNPGEGEVSTYNALAEPRQVVGSWTNALQKEHQRDLLMTFGHGDGGGGPTREMLENLQAMKAMPGAPHVRQAAALEFFRALEQHSGDKLPTWSGELYLELHRGTYTTQSRTKRHNRKLEVALHNAEFLCALAQTPAAELDAAWQTLCLNQFHDVLPGSSVAAVYEDTETLYTEAHARVRQVSERALDQLGGEILLVNPTSFPRREVVFTPHDLNSEALLTQKTDEGTWVACEVPPYSAVAYPVGPSDDRVKTTLSASVTHLENSLVRAEFNELGDLIRFYDKLNAREILQSSGNQFQAFDDRPINWDAWDIDIFYDDKFWLSRPATSIRLIESGPLVATLEIKRQILDSPYTQRVRLAYNSARLDFETRIDWRERRKLLKVAFPVNVQANQATYEIQWGVVERPTHRNTSWDWARFEVCAHKWADLSEHDWGVSLLNDCKYGHDIRANVMRLTLLRSPMSPDPQADAGEHLFTYSLFPHAGRWGTPTQREAYALNYPILVHLGQCPAPQHRRQLVECDEAWAIVETVKPADDGRGVIVRMFSSQPRRGDVHLRGSFTRMIRTDLYERDLEPVETLNLSPFEIVTLRLL